MMATFNIPDVGQIPGESPVVHESAGMKEKITGNAIETFGGLAKKAYEGYVVAGLEGTAGTAGEVPTLPEDEQEQNRGFTKIVQAYQSGALSQRDAQLLAKRQKNEAISQAPWMREGIERRYSNFFSSGGSGGSGGGVFGQQKDDQEMIKDVMIKSLTQDVKAGDFHVGLDETDDVALERYARYQQSKVELNNLKKGRDGSFAQIMSSIDGASPEIGIMFTNAISAIASNEMLSVSDKKQAMYSAKARFIGNIKKKSGLNGLPPEKAKIFDERVSKKLDTIINTFDKENVLSGSADVTRIKSDIEELIQRNKLNNLVSNKDLLELATFRATVGSQVTEIVMRSSKINLNLLKNLNVSTFGRGKREDISEEQQQALVNLNNSRMSDEDESVVRQSIKMQGLFDDKQAVDEYYSKMSPKKLRMQVRFAEDFIDNSAVGAISEAFNRGDADEYYLRYLDIVVNESGTGIEFDLRDKYEGTVSREDIAGASEALKVIKKLEPEFSGYYNISRKSGATGRTILSEIQRRLNLGAIPEQKPRPFVEEAGEFTSKAFEGVADLTGKTIDKFMENPFLFGPLGGALDSPLTEVGRERLQESGITLRDWLDDFIRGYKSGEERSTEEER